MEYSSLIKLEKWYQSQCNGEWEHNYGITIGTLDNPGWTVDIDLKETDIEGANMENLIVDNGDNDWIHLKIIDDLFIGRGDPKKLHYIIEAFLHFVEKQKGTHSKV